MDVNLKKTLKKTFEERKTIKKKETFRKKNI